MENKTVLLVTSGLEHPSYEGRMALFQALAGLNGVEFNHIKSLEQFPSETKNYAALVLYFHENLISKKALNYFLRFVSKGGGILAVHSVSASYLKESKYFDVIGGRFLDHGPISRFIIKPTSNLEIFSGIDEFSVEDELYLHEIKPDISPCFTTVHNHVEVPVVWTSLYGKGRVCYASPGHQPETMQNVQYQKILKCGLQWVINH